MLGNKSQAEFIPIGGNMALKITLKPHEKMILGGAVITNGNNMGCHLIIENKVPILREKDILGEKDADTTCRQLYFIIQLMYIDEQNLVLHQKKYWKLVKELVKAASSTVGRIDLISEEIVRGRYYQALKLAQKLIDYEQEVISRVQ
jgi:flagellar protein FlbT